MKRRIVFAVAVLAAMALCAGLWVVRGISPLTTGDAPIYVDAAQDVVTVYGELDADGTLKIEQIFDLSNRSGAGLEEIVLRIYANADGLGAVQSLSARVNADPVEAKIDEDDATLLRIMRPWAKEEKIELTLFAEILVDFQARTAVIPLPVLAPIRDGEWQSEIWEPLASMTYALAMDGEMEIQYPKEWSAVFSDGLRGLSLAVSQKGCVRWREIKGIAVSAMADNVFKANRLLDCAQTALESLEAIGLDYPFASLAIVAAQPVSADGDVYSSMIVLETEGRKEEITQRMTRLIAAQTFGVLVGNDAWNAPWLSRSLSSAAELLAYRQRKGQAAFEARVASEIEVASRVTRPYGVTVGAGIDRFGSDAEMTRVLRDQGGAMLLGIEQAMGEETFMAALQLYIKENAGHIADQAALERALEAISGSSWSGYLEDELSF